MFSSCVCREIGDAKTVRLVRKHRLYGIFIVCLIDLWLSHVPKDT